MLPILGLCAHDVKGGGHSNMETVEVLLGLEFRIDTAKICWSGIESNIIFLCQKNQKRRGHWQIGTHMWLFSKPLTHSAH